MGAGGAARPPSLPHPCFPPPALLSLSLCSARRQVAGLVGLLPFLPLSLFLSFPSLSSLSYLLPGCRAGWLARLAGRAATASLYCLILQTFCFLSCPFPPAGPLAEPAPLLKKHPYLCCRGRPYMPKWSGRLSGGGVVRGVKRAESGLDCALRLSPIIRRQKPAKTPKYFFLGLLWVV